MTVKIVQMKKISDHPFDQRGYITFDDGVELYFRSQTARWPAKMYAKELVARAEHLMLARERLVAAGVPGFRERSDFL
jgi:hypothetical protein